MALDEHNFDEYDEHDPEECELCLETNRTNQSQCGCGDCCERLIIEVTVRDAEREPRIVQEGSPTYDDDFGHGPKELVGYLLHKRGQGDTACMFFDRSTRRCAIYETRPLICRLFDCDGEGRKQLNEIRDLIDGLSYTWQCPSPMALFGPVLRRHETEKLLEAARLIQACPSDTPDRIDEARQLLRRVLREHALGNVSAKVRAAVVRVLAFAIDGEAVSTCTQRTPMTQELEPTERIPMPSDVPDSAT